MSRFLQNIGFKDESFRQEIDFEDAIRLPDGGSTCDTYRTRWQRREVFVKRLKEEYRTNPIYLDALDKEFEIGVNLKHPSLPDYREFHRDYIVMDFIDGTTLADMIKHQDSWLKNEKHIIKMLRELVEVTDYLHRHNVTHCDIKPDNIMITANNHNVVLIDFDKCYTDSLCDTSGDPSKYGLTSMERGRISIDFHGIERVVELIKEKLPGFSFRKYNEFVKECKSKDCTPDKLLEILDHIPVNYLKRYNWLMTLAPFIVALIFGIALWLTQEKNGYEDSDGIIDTLPVNKDSIKLPPTETPKEDRASEKTIISPSSRSQEQIHLEAQEMATQLDKRIQSYFDELNAGIENLATFSNDSDVTSTQLLDSIRKHADKEDEYFQETFAILNETFPGLSEREQWRVMAYSKAYTGYKRKAEPILRELGLKVKGLN